MAKEEDYKLKCPYCKKAIKYFRTDADLTIFEEASLWWHSLRPDERLEFMYDVYCMINKKGKVK
jgi:hypothetical protein